MFHRPQSFLVFLRSCAIAVCLLAFFCAAPLRAEDRRNFTAVTFPATDGLEVSADFYSTGAVTAPTIILVHQSMSSRGEYREIAPRLVRLGFNALAIDSRWGQLDRWNHVPNETAQRAGTAAIVGSKDQTRMRRQQEDAGKDVTGAMQWLTSEGYKGPRLLWGSSISANLVLKLAAEPKSEIAAVISVSPGEYHPDTPNELRSAIRKLKIPTLIACGSDEEETSKPIFEALPPENRHYYRASRAGHGSSLWLDDNSNWNAVERFLTNLPSVQETNAVLSLKPN